MEEMEGVALLRLHAAAAAAAAAAVDAGAVEAGEA